MSKINNYGSIYSFIHLGIGGSKSETGLQSRIDSGDVNLCVSVVCSSCMPKIFFFNLAILSSLLFLGVVEFVFYIVQRNGL